MAKKFRFDGWVKSAQGAAVPGAQVYVCTQPANTSTAPPTPLAAAYSDVNGLVPITQPVLTDGFGHYDFYVAAGRYTIVVALGAVIQQIYEDQVPMGANVGGTDSTPVLKTDGVANVTQDILDLKSGTGITLTSDVSGGVTVDSSGSGGGPLLQTNGIDNTEQNLLNLINTPSVEFQDNGDGSVQGIVRGYASIRGRAGTIVPAANQHIVTGYASMPAGTAQTVTITLENEAVFSLVTGDGYWVFVTSADNGSSMVVNLSTAVINASQFRITGDNAGPFPCTVWWMAVGTWSE